MNTNSVLLITFCVFKSFIWNLVQGDRMRKKLLLRAHSTRSQQTINQDSLKKNHQNLFFKNGCILINTKTSALWHLQFSPTTTSRFLIHLQTLVPSCGLFKNYNMCYLHISIPTFLTCLCLAGHVCLHALRSAFNMKHWWKKGDDSGFGGNVWKFIAFKIDHWYKDIHMNHQAFFI